ncbi:MAG: pyridoxamine 5'-phosphate oxidase family protein [Anaerolineales bacterium]|nr:pyridoxamine 5'-phosphate oxidase family protein [Anaerolineales bacterium]
MASLFTSALQDDERLRTLFVEFATAEACWFASVRPDARAHLAPIWHVWLLPQIYVVTQRTSVRAANIRVNTWVSLSLADPMNPIIVEGTAAPAPHMRKVLRQSFLDKYAWDLEADAAYNDVIAVMPRKLMTWGKHGEGRWHFT